MGTCLPLGAKEAQVPEIPLTRSQRLGGLAHCPKLDSRQRGLHGALQGWAGKDPRKARGRGRGGALAWGRQVQREEEMSRWMEVEKVGVGVGPL